MIYNYYKKGVALLMAVVITATSLAIALGIFSIIYGQILISRAAKESHIAFYSADTGMECALYYLWQGDQSAPGRNFWEPTDPCFMSSSGTCEIKCAGVTVLATDVAVSPLASTPYKGGTVDERTYRFELKKDPTVSPKSPGVCATINVVAQYFNYPDVNMTKTVITSDGKNICSGNFVVDRQIEYIECADLDAPECP